MFADLHCHPSNRSFNRIRNSDEDPLNVKNVFPLLNEDKTIWYEFPEDIAIKKQQQRAGFRAGMSTYPQCDMASITNADVYLVFAALYPIEKGFVSGSGKVFSASVVTEIVNMVLTKKGLKWLAKILKPITSNFDAIVSLLVNNKGPGRDLLQHWVMRFTTKRVNFLQQDSYHYFEEMQKERWLYEYGDNQKPQIDGIRKYQLIRDSAHLKRVFGSGDIAVVQTLEGMHMLSQRSDSKGNPEYVGWNALAQNIREVKTWNIFFITFCHHYDNSLAGHARSLPELMQQISNQEPRRHEGFQKDPGQLVKDGDGMKAARFLLSLDDNLQDDATAGPRILIDVKHMAARARKEYYDEIITLYNTANPNKKIPVIASHVGYSGRKTLQELISNADQETDELFKNSFYQWNINLSDEDVRMIVESGGIIGLSFDQRIIGVDLATHPQTDSHWAGYLVNNIVAFVNACIDSTLSQPYRAWDCIGLGSDFDGFIDPVDPFATSERFGYCMSEILKLFEAMGEPTKRYLGLLRNPYTPGEVIEKIAYKNAFDFTTRNF